MRCPGIKRSLTPLHFLCTQCKQPPQKIALPPYFCLTDETCIGSIPDSFNNPRLMPDFGSFIFPMLKFIHRHFFFSIPDFQVLTFTSNSSMDSALIIRSSCVSSFKFLYIPLSLFLTTYVGTSIKEYFSSIDTCRYECQTA